MKSFFTRCKAGFLAFAMTLQMLPMVYATDPDPAIGCNCDGMHELTDWIELTAELVDSQQGNLATGNYFLEEDLTLNVDLDIRQMDVVLCLNDNTITGSGSGSVITLNSGKLTLYGGENGEGVLTGGSNRYGGGIESTGSTVHLEDVNIKGNSASIFGAGLAMISSTLTMDGVTIENNNSTYSAGGISLSNSTFTIENSKIINNTATNQGGGLYINSVTGGTTTGSIENTTITGNTTTNSEGDGIYLGSTGDSGATTTLTLDGNQLNISDQLYLHGDTALTLSEDFALTTGNIIPVTMASNGVFTENAKEAHLKYFSSGNSSYNVVKTFDGSGNFQELAVEQVTIDFDFEEYFAEDLIYVWHVDDVNSQMEDFRTDVQRILTALGEYPVGGEDGEVKFNASTYVDDAVGVVFTPDYDSSGQIAVSILDKAIAYLETATGNMVEIRFTVNNGPEVVFYVISEAVETFRVLVDEEMVHGSVTVQKSYWDDGLEYLEEITRIDHGEKVTLTVNPEEHWVVETVTVVDSLDTPVEVTPDSKVPSNYTFTMPTSEVLVSITFIEEEYTVTFDANGGNFGTDVNDDLILTVDKNTGAYWRLVLGEFEELPEPEERAGVSFMGWFLQDEDGNLTTEINKNTQFKEDTTVYAKWSNNPVIKLDYQGGESEDGTSTLELADWKILDFSALTSLAPTKEGYEFLGWFTEAEDGKEVTADTIFEADDVIYAQWEILKFTVTFDFNEISDPTDPVIESTKIDVELVKWGTTVAEPSNAVTKTGYTRSHWYYDLPDGDNYKNYEADELVYDANGYAMGVIWDLDEDLVQEDITLYALWELFCYTVTFEYRDGDLIGVEEETENLVKTEVAYGSTVTITAEKANPEHTGYRFTWYYMEPGIDPDTSAPTETKKAWNFDYTLTEELTISDNLTIFAEWTLLTYDITFDFQETDTDPQADLVLTKDHYSLLEDPTTYLPTDDFALPTKEGYTMYGWYYLATDFTEVESEDIVYNEDEEKIGILWDFDTDYVGEKLSFYDVPVEGEVWNEEVDGKLTLYANWKINGYTVTFDYNDSDLICVELGLDEALKDHVERPVQHGDSLQTDPEDILPTHTGYTFLGWFYELDGVETPWSFGEVDVATGDYTPTIIESDLYIYAKWELISYKVTYINEFVDDDGVAVSDSVTIDANHFDLLDQPDNKYTRLSHTQNGWYYIPVEEAPEDGDGEEAPEEGDGAETPEEGETAPEEEPDYATDDEDETLGILWNFAKDYVGEDLSYYAETTEGELLTLTLYANWEIHIYDVNFLWEFGGDITVEEDLYDFQEVKYDRVALVPDPDPFRRLYTFLGWYDRNSKVAEDDYEPEIESDVEDPEAEPDGEGEENGEGEGDDFTEIPDDNGIVYLYEKWDFDTTITEDETLFADWLKNPTVTLVPIGSDDGEVWYEIELTKASGGNLNLSIEPDGVLPTPVREGYVFLGWYTHPINWTDENKVDPVNSTFNNGDSLYGAWEIEIYNIIFGALDLDQYTDPVEYEYGSYIEEPEKDIFVKAGSEIVSWYYIKEENGQRVLVPWDFAVDTAFADMVLYCEWDTASWAVTFDFQDEGVTEDNIVYVQHNDKVPEPVNPTRTGYDFVGWYYWNYLDEETPWDFTTAITNDYRIHAVWEIQVYTLNFYHNDIYSDDDGFTDTETETLGIVVEYNADIPPVLPEPHKGLAVFLGWYRDKGTWLDPLDITEPMPELLDLPASERVVDLHAKWTEEFDVVLDYQNGEENGFVTTQLNGQLKEEDIPPDPTHSNPAYEFKGWYDSPTEGEKIDLNQLGGYTFWDHCTIYAQWYVYPTITLVSGEGGSIDSTSFILGTDGILSSDMIETVETTPEEYYYFRGWYTTIDGDIPVSWGTIYTEDTTIYAQWTRLPIYRIALATTEGGSIGSSFLMTSDDGTLTTAVLNSVVTTADAGYTFKGWFTTASGSLQINGSTEFTEDTTIYAQWTQDPPPVYTITLESTTGGSLSTNFIQTTGTLYQDQLDGITKTPETGYAFKGWYTTATGYTEVDLDRIYTEDTTIYAQWEEVVDAVYSYGIVNDASGNPLEGVSITLMQNGEIIDTSTSDVMGYYYFNNIYGGYYNILMEYASLKQTVAVTLNRMDKVLPTLTFYGYAVSSTVTISNETPVLAVVGMDALAGIVSTGSTFTLELYVNKTFSQQSMDSILSVLGYRESIVSFFDIDLYKTTYQGSTVTEQVPMLETASLLQFILDIPSDFRGMDSYSVLRIHDGGLDILNETINSYGERIEVSGDGRHLSIYTRNFSTFALVGSISKQDVPQVELPPEEEEESYVIYDVGYVQMVNGVSASTSSVAGAVEFSTRYPMEGDYVYVTPLPNAGYYMEYLYVETNAGDTVGTSLMSDGSYRFIQGDSKYTVTVNFRKIQIETPVESLFQDVSATDSYCTAINQVVSWGLMSGTSSNTFSPDSSLTRGMIVTILHNLSGDRYTGSSRFSDVYITDYYYNSVVWAEDVGIIAGYDNGTFRPHQAINREELAVILDKFCKSQNLQSFVWAFTEDFADQSSISSWALNSALFCVNEGIIPLENSYFKAKTLATRGEVAVSLVVIYHLLYG